MVPANFTGSIQHVRRKFRIPGWKGRIFRPSEHAILGRHVHFVECETRRDDSKSKVQQYSGERGQDVDSSYRDGRHGGVQKQRVDESKDDHNLIC